MADVPTTGAVNHLTLTVTDVDRSIDFYTTHLGFQLVVKFEPHRALLSNGGALLALGPSYFDEQANPDDVFSEFRVGLDHVSFTVPSLQALEDAAVYFDEQGIPHGEVKDLGPGFGLYVLAFRDPDNIQLELTAVYQ